MMQKYQFLTKKPKDAGTKHFNNCITFIEYSNNMDDIHKSIEDYNLNKKLKY